MDIHGRNIVDKYWGWTQDLIKKDLQENAFPCAVLIENFEHDFNISTIIRSSNAFGVKEIYYLGRKRFDRRGTVGTQHYSVLKHLKNHNELEILKKEYTFIGVDNISSSVPMESFSWPKNSLLIFGSECDGITKETQEYCEKMVYITQYGSVRSLNAGCAASIALFDYTTKYNK